GIAIEGHPAVDADPDSDGPERIPVTNVIGYSPITDGTAQPREQVVAIEKCNDCHNQLSVHGSNRTDNIEVCVICHNPNATDAGVRNANAGDQVNCGPGTDDVPIDMKYMIHAIHASAEVGVPYDVCGFGGNAQTLDFAYPGRLNNCEGCHVADTYYPVEPGEELPTTVDAGADITTPVDDTVTSPNAAACSACHTSDVAISHMQLNGSAFSVARAADGTAVNGAESCGVCHGPGAIADVAEAHGVDEFPLN
ncbi:MAG TPA: hypothetical protein VLT59_08875, partial [Steroidobacteraceae bacterium]|nr:hypothetical protein [Steroidobacteraceae bacterium]